MKRLGLAGGTRLDFTWTSSRTNIFAEDNCLKKACREIFEQELELGTVGGGLAGGPEF
jgi:hypothetical protein